jgi:hypothetical protein
VHESTGDFPIGTTAASMGASISRRFHHSHNNSKQCIINQQEISPQATATAASSASAAAKISARSNPLQNMRVCI